MKKYKEQLNEYRVRDFVLEKMYVDYMADYILKTGTVEPGHEYEAVEILKVDGPDVYNEGFTEFIEFLISEKKLFELDGIYYGEDPEKYLIIIEN